MIAITTMNKIPEYCYDCPCHDGNNGKCKAANRYSSDDRPNWCPLSDAIPVEWLKEQIAEVPDSLWASLIKSVMNQWQKEQDVR